MLIYTLEWRSSARAKATSCFCPALRGAPPSVRTRSRPCPVPSIMSARCARRRAAQHSASLCSPKGVRLKRRLPVNKTGTCSGTKRYQVGIPERIDFCPESLSPPEANPLRKGRRVPASLEVVSEWDEQSRAGPMHRSVISAACHTARSPSEDSLLNHDDGSIHNCAFCINCDFRAEIERFVPSWQDSC